MGKRKGVLVLRRTAIRIAIGSLVCGLGLATLTNSPAVAAQQHEFIDLDPGPVPQAEPLGRSLQRALTPRAGAESQCQNGRFGPGADDAEKAAEIMRGFATSNYGRMKVKPNMNWRAQAGLDYSGNGWMHSLFWTLPLLRTGQKTNDPAMIARFYTLNQDWIRDNWRKAKPKAKHGQAMGALQFGFRLHVFACALAGPAPAKAAKQIRQSVARQAKYLSTRSTSGNNVVFWMYSGLFAAGVTLGNQQYIARGLSGMDRVAGNMIVSDGSVREGSCGYSRYWYAITQQEIPRITSAGYPVPANVLNSYTIPDFLAYCVQPDGKFESLGDSERDNGKADIAPPGSRLAYSAGGCATGTNPVDRFRVFGAGFIFGRSGWGESRSCSDETGYSISTHPGHAYQYHAHSDQGALTVVARGKPLLMDAGIYADRRDDAARFVRSRAAHNVVLIGDQKYSSPSPAVLATAHNANDLDLVALRDSSYGKKGTIERTVVYDRQGDYFVVVDNITSNKSRQICQNWNFRRDRNVNLDSSQSSTTGPGANLTAISVGGTGSHSVIEGSKNPWGGWNSQKYGELVASPSLRVCQGGSSVRLVTVLIPRGGGVDASHVSATGTFNATGATVTTKIGKQSYGLDINTMSAVRFTVAEPTPTPTATPSSSESGSASAPPSP